MEIVNAKQIVEPTKLSATYEHKAKSAKSGDKLLSTYVKTKNHIEQNKKKCTSKLPRFVRNSSFYRSNKNICKQNGKENTGDIVIGANKRSIRMQKPKNNDPYKQKPSGIPRRKNIIEEPITDNTSLKKQSDHLLYEAKNIQRVQMLINADLCSDDRTQATSVVSAKPIPTLGQIYRPDNLIETDRFHDWFMSLNTPLNSFESNLAIESRPSIDIEHRGITDVDIDTSYDESTLVVDKLNLIQQIYKATNENVNEWINSELDCLGVDNESGYRSLSPENLRRAGGINSKQIDTPAVKNTHENNEMNFNEKDSTKHTNNSIEDNSQGLAVKNESFTDISKIQKMNIDLAFKKFRLSKNGFSELFEHQHTLKTKELNDQDGDIREENISYVECPSEILQRTTNFEGCESSKTVSSILATDFELSSQCTLEQIYASSILEVHSADDWTSQCKSRRSENLVKIVSNGIENGLGYLHHNSCEDNKTNSSDHYHNSNCWKKQVLQQKFKTKSNKKGRCKKCKRFQTYPSIRYKFTKRLDSFGKQLWVRICRKRWNHVWKKTAERWALWSKSPSKLKKVRMMHYLQRAIIWEDAKVQTTLLVFRETGTDAVLKEQRSAAISALLKFESNKYYDAPHTSKAVSKKSRVNSGPSMFPFLHNSNAKTLFLEKRKDSFEIVPQDSNAPERYFIINSNQEEVDNKIVYKMATSTSPIFNQIKNDMQSSANHIQLQMPALLDAGTQMCIIYNNAETDALHATCANSVATFMSCYLPFSRLSETNTESKHVQVESNNTEPENKSRKSYDMEIQAVSPRPIRISRAITTTQLGQRELPVGGTTTSVDAVQKKHFSAQAMPITTTFTYTKPKLLSISSAMMKTASATMSKQEIITTGVPANDVNIIESCHGLTTSYPQSLCHRADYKPCKDETKSVDHLKSSSYIISHNPQSFKRAGNANNPFRATEKINNNCPASTKPISLVNSMNAINNELLLKSKLLLTDVATNTEEAHPIIAPPTKNMVLIKKTSSTGTYTKVDSQTPSRLINEICKTANNLTRDIFDSIEATNARDGLEVTKKEAAEPTTIKEKGFTTYTNVEIEARPILVEKATDFIRRKSFVREKSVSTSAHANVKDTIETIIEQSLKEANQLPLVEDKSVCTQISDFDVLLHVQIPTVNNNKTLVNKKSATTSNLNNVIKQTSPELIEEGTSAVNHSLACLTDFGEQIQPEYKEQYTVIENEPTFKEKSLLTSTCKIIEEETLTKSIDYTKIHSINRPLLKSNMQVNTDYEEEKQHPSCVVNKLFLMSADNQSINEMTTQTEQHCNEVGTSASALLTKSCYQVLKDTTPVPTQTPNSFLNNTKKTGPCRACACAASNYDCGTSTKVSKVKLNFASCEKDPECATQTTSVDQRNTKIISASNQISSKPSRDHIQHDPISDKIISLSRLIGQRDFKTENYSHRHPSSMPSSALNANNWIRTCTSLQRRENACQSMDNCDKSLLEDLKHLSSGTITTTTQHCNKMNNNPVKHKDFVISTLPAFTLSKDSLADVLPTQKVLKFISPSEILNKDSIMIDQATSDEVNVKDLKECTLQACPEISNKATDVPVSKNHKSACILTSHSLLPTIAPCSYPKSYEKVPKDCVFIYREPHCMVYNQQTDAGVQRKPSNKDVEVEPIDLQHQIHVSVGSSIPGSKVPICCHKKSSEIAGEVLSPRVYKALYETTKLVFKEDLTQSQPLKYLNQQPSFRNAAINSHPLDTDMKFTMVQSPEVRSATVMTQCKSLHKPRHCVDESTQPETVETKDRDVDANTQTRSMCRSSFTDVAAEKDCSEDCVKTHLAASCRYYSNLLTKQIGRVKENLTRHLAPPTDTTYRYNTRLPKVEACTMKPSARQELGCQTIKICRYCDVRQPPSYTLSPTSSLTDICRYDREHLKSVYYILSAIEGRIRRLKANVSN